MVIYSMPSSRERPMRAWAMSAIWYYEGTPGPSLEERGLYLGDGPR
jgi:hypothetical protein